MLPSASCFAPSLDSTEPVRRSFYLLKVSHMHIIDFINEFYYQTLQAIVR